MQNLATWFNITISVQQFEKNFEFLSWKTANAGEYRKDRMHHRSSGESVQSKNFLAL